MRALVTGGAGFIGGHIARDLKRRGYYVIVADNLSTGNTQNLKGIDEFFELDLGRDNISKIFKKEYDLIYHFAGQSSVQMSYSDPIYDLDTNVRSTLNIINHIKNYTKKLHLIYASSMSVYGGDEPMPKREDSPLNGKNFYAIGKKASESYLSLCSSRNIKTTSLRLFNIYGPGQNLENLNQGMLSIYLAQAINNDKIIVKGNLNRSRDFVYINDLIRLTNKIENNPSCFGKIVNICSGKETKVSELIFAIENSLNKKLTILEQASTKGDIKRMIGCNNLLKEITGIKTETNIKDGLNQMIEALNANKYFE